MNTERKSGDSTPVVITLETDEAELFWHKLNVDIGDTWFNYCKHHDYAPPLGLEWKVWQNFDGVFSPYGGG